MSFEDGIRKVVPYVAGEQPADRNIIKLNTNENPYPPAPGVQTALRELADRSAELRLYPDMNAAPLTAALAKKYGLDPEQIYVGVGSDDVLSMCFLTFFNTGKPILFPDITYSFYDVWADLYRIPYIQVPLDENFDICADGYLRDNGGVIFPNPNAPTGVEADPQTVEKIIAGNPGSIVIVDEAYVDFGARSVLPLLDRYENLIVVQTFSKSRAMAGMRIGFAMASPGLIRALKDVKFSFNSYTMNLPSILCGAEAVKDDGYFREITAKIVSAREDFEEKLRGMGFVFRNSKSNFVFARHPDISGDELFEKLRGKNICVRHFGRPRIREYLRITIGTPAQMEAVTHALKEILEER
ncbi:MAG: aminotransferase class I/II-fold pyridoxal phosphate-dependent enzyme [Lachnospiraceae bacterium]|jgi:histidinol-phosphate aminotransferase|nr:aminotransferase class I/II-fold pyridoxal phosphate-dependent enzyme [Lachnospiraceae bacterium]